MDDTSYICISHRDTSSSVLVHCYSASLDCIYGSPLQDQTVESPQWHTHWHCNVLLLFTTRLLLGFLATKKNQESSASCSNTTAANLLEPKCSRLAICNLTHTYRWDETKLICNNITRIYNPKSMSGTFSRSVTIQYPCDDVNVFYTKIHKS